MEDRAVNSCHIQDTCQCWRSRLLSLQRIVTGVQRPSSAGWRGSRSMWSWRKAWAWVFVMLPASAGRPPSLEPHLMSSWKARLMSTACTQTNKHSHIQVSWIQIHLLVLDRFLWRESEISVEFRTRLNLWKLTQIQSNIILFTLSVMGQTDFFPLK